MLPVVILVWGFVFYQLYTYFFSKPSIANQETTYRVNEDEIKRDTFSIVANYRDPFLGAKTSVTNEAIKTNNYTSNKTVTSSKITTDLWPSIEYHGMIKNNNSNKRVGIIKIDSKEFIVKEGDEKYDVKIIQIDKEEIKVRFQKESRTVTK
ncbi:MAG: hypothetical protein A3K10_17235 [Bacteroidetes bacterium RIFCSPLOWO2_12_FULL_31_6]|nr:MAG: hypothetical protein A3K10_17235 [Bacteroidetes bacterium RIFCSPLOWO2_12_FULL_31_6]